MTIQNTYRKAVDRLPISGKKKNFLIRNWIGSITAVILFLVSMYFYLVLSNTNFIFQIMTYPILVVSAIFLFTGIFDIISVILGITIWAFGGAYIQSLIRKVLK